MQHIDHMLNVKALPNSSECEPWCTRARLRTLIDIPEDLLWK